MANFWEAYNLLKEVEFSNNNKLALHNISNDKGGLTYKGISRNFNPYWIGWSYIDEILEENKDSDYGEVSLILEKRVLLQNEVSNFYKIQYWDRIWGNALRDQKLANSFFLFAVNVGLKTAIKKIQSLVDTKEDGIMGVITINKINNFGFFLLDLFKEAQKKYYHDLVAVDKDREKFLKGWLRRVETV